MPGYIYLASPYSSQDLAVLNERFLQAEATVAHYLRKGVTLYSPIVAHHALADKFAMPKDVDFWLPHNLAMLARADFLYILMIPGWQQSKGVTLEREYALDHRIPEFLVSVGGDAPCSRP
jgi:hypothetical protein